MLNFSKEELTVTVDLGKRIENQIVELVEKASTETPYRRPLAGFASAQDPLFGELKEIIGSHHLLPEDILPGAKTVGAFFLPFGKQVVDAHRQADEVAREWALAYVETNRLIGEICLTLQASLKEEGINMAFQKPTHTYDPADFKTAWGHKSAAFIAGLGRFGNNRLLITEKGCAGRFGTFVMDVELTPTPRPEAEYCEHKQGGKCLYCVKICPQEALDTENLDKHSCHQQLLLAQKRFAEIGVADVCGKCAMGPCAYYE